MILSNLLNGNLHCFRKMPKTKDPRKEQELPTFKFKSVSSPISPPDSDYSAPVVKQDLERCSLHSELVFTIPGFLLPDECACWIKFAEETGFEETKHPAAAGYAHRDNGRLQFTDTFVASLIFERMRKALPTCSGKIAVGCSSNIRIYRYFEGQRFGKHIDDSNFEKETGSWSEFTLLLYLNEVNLGGETVFYDGSKKAVLTVSPVAGLALIHGHGERCMLHEGRSVKRGVKYLLRTDVLYKD